MKIHLLIAAISVCATPAHAQDTTPPTLLAPAANLTLECDGTESWQVPFQAWLGQNGGAMAVDDSGYYYWTNDFVPVLRASLAVSTYAPAQAQATAPLATSAERVAALDLLVDGCSVLETTVTFTAWDLAGNSVSTTATFRLADTTAPTMAWDLDGTPIADAGIYTMSLRDLPITVNITATDLCSDFTLFKRFDYTGTTTAPGVTFGTTSFTVTSGTAGSSVVLYAYATDGCGNTSAEEFVTITFESGKGKPQAKGNQGVGNGVDPNTPGYTPSGMNDDPQFGIGNPGARYKNRP